MKNIDLLKEIEYLQNMVKSKENAIHVLKMQNLDLRFKLEKFKRKKKSKIKFC